MIARKIMIILALFLAGCVSAPMRLEQPLPLLPEFGPEDRVLFLAPHPDDETIGTGGAIQRAINSGATVQVAWLTNGDNNELAFIVYEKRLTFRKGEFIHMGEVRRKEALAATQVLGLTPQQTVFLGYPDFGTMNIFHNYWGKTRPFRSMLTRVTQVPYKDCLSSGAPYTGESILKDFETLLLDFRPTKVFLTLPADVNVDHRSIYLFLQVAIWNVESRLPRPPVFGYLVHVVKWPTPRGFHPGLLLRPPENFANSDVYWMQMNLTDEEIQTKKQAIAKYRSQIQYNPPYLYTFDRHNELFGRYPMIRLENTRAADFNWDQMEARMHNDGQEIDPDDPTPKNIEAVTYALVDNVLTVRIKMRTWDSKYLGVKLYLYGYRHDVLFGRMPKLWVYLRAPNTIAFFEKRRRIKIPDATCEFKRREVTVRIPLNRLIWPEYILSSAAAKAKGLTQDATAWRILDLRPDGEK